jgi:hypothetical protein
MHRRETLIQMEVQIYATSLANKPSPYKKSGTYIAVVNMTGV